VFDVDLYTINRASPFNAVDNIDGYNSLIWTERFSSNGDFTLVTANIESTLQKMPKGSIVSIRQSSYLMIVENLKVENDDDGGVALTVTGRSLETYLENRPARAVGATSDSDWAFNNAYPIATAISMVQQLIATAPLNANDVIPNLEMITSIVETTQTNYVIESRDLYSAVLEVLTPAGYGILPRKDASGKLYFEVFKGVDKTVGQTAVDPIIFHVANGDITDASYLFTTSDFYNVAYVYSSSGMRVVYAPGVDSTISSWDRRILYVDASDISTTTTAEDGTETPIDPSIINAAMDQRGASELASHNIQMLFDGQINPISTSYKTPQDYYLGDQVTLIADYGVSQTMQVEEVIRIQDADGDRTYPTLTVT
jgi:hypothetical protein